eukprot:4004359-Alexandrium_andersonii.AAC.1
MSVIQQSYQNPSASAWRRVRYNTSRPGVMPPKLHAPASALSPSCLQHRTVLTRSRVHARKSRSPPSAARK